MAELIPILTPLLLVDVLNAVLLAAMIFTAGSTRPVANSSALLLGHTIAYLLVGVLALFGVEKLMTRLASHQPVDFMFQLLLGLACFYGAFASRGGRASEEHNPGGELRRDGVEKPDCVGRAQADDRIGQQRRGRDRDSAARSLERRASDSRVCVQIEVQRELVAAERIDPLGSVSGVRELAEMPRVARMIENQLAIQVLHAGHAKMAFALSRAATRR